VKQNIFEKAGMKHSFIMSTANMNLYTPSFKGNGVFNFEYLDAIYGDKNVYTTVTDLKRYDSAIHNRLLLDSNSYALAWQPWYKDGQHRDSHEYYGLGWRLKVWPDGKKIVYHNGWWHGNNSCFQRLIMDTAVIIVTGNKFNSAIYKAGRAANIFRDYYDANGGEDGEEGGVVDTKNIKQQLPVRERRGRHYARNQAVSRSRSVKSTRATKQTKQSKQTKQKTKAPTKRKRR
jgi:CubicO group peptidase (beta-lactamase class C family)